MSEYQYYEFLAIDRPLTTTQKNELRAFSTRAEITSTRFINEYNYGGGFRGDTDEFLSKYFDAMVYVTNWGTHQFAFNVPKNLIDLSAVECYCTEYLLNIRPVGGSYIFDMCLEEEEGGGWEEGGGYLPSLAGLRAEVIGGDRRPLFIAWLAGSIFTSDDDPVPPIPAGLKNLTAPQQALVDFLKVEDDLIHLAATRSLSAVSAPALEIERALARISPDDRDAWLKELIESDDPHAATRIRLKLQAAVLPKPEPFEAPSNLTAGELRELYEKHAKDIEDHLRLQREAKHREDSAKAAAARAAHLDAVAKNISSAWRNIDQMIGLKKDEGYREAVKLMKDLFEISRRPGGDPTDFAQRLATRLREHARKARFMELVRKADVI